MLSGGAVIEFRQTKWCPENCIERLRAVSSDGLLGFVTEKKRTSFRISITGQSGT